MGSQRNNAIDIIGLFSEALHSVWSWTRTVMRRFSIAFFVSRSREHDATTQRENTVKPANAAAARGSDKCEVQTRACERFCAPADGAARLANLQALWQGRAQETSRRVIALSYVVSGTGESRVSAIWTFVDEIKCKSNERSYAAV
jgi:hypothetical protein